MKPGSFIRWTVLLAVLTAAAGCSTTRVRDAGEEMRSARYESRSVLLAAVGSWALDGRLAVADGKDGGSGSFRWQELEQGTQMDFHGALGRGAWRLNAGSSGAELELADGARYRSSSINDLVTEQLGWSVPVDALAWWVRGLAAPVFVSGWTLDEEGRLRELLQLDWVVEYSRYRDVNGIMMPGKITARQAGRSVKLAVRNWTLDGDQQP